MLGVAGRIYLGLVLVFLYAPIAVMAAMSFNKSQFYTLPIQWSLRWYDDLAGNERLLEAGFNSIVIAIITTVIASALGTAASLAFFRYEFRGKRILQLLLFPPIAIPWLITGTAMLLFFFWTGVGRGLHAMVLGHVALALPYVIIVVSARLKAFDPDLEAAARSLGASPWQVARHVTLPFLAPGIIAAALFAFAVSFDQFVISYFLAVPGVSTLPVEIYTSIRKGFTPEINAISTIVIVSSMVILIIVSRFYRFGGDR
ncbi:ABC transporter permease [Acuticoccus sp. MNP-M23]|uniref:ABC transporter permease n=1 Tax=Acuticoccus sp. MNP-M23 TaxID=3072793 RepID=UPI0028156D99|nr:ABC transporter permease [Acuticoccus sp. MNP-M23]WMS43560.1 ABC transporter permease [Acuticoccus sp. MNP-M23]